jgi:hypothetical protein
MPSQFEILRTRREEDASDDESACMSLQVRNGGDAGGSRTSVSSASAAWRIHSTAWSVTELLQELRFTLLHRAGSLIDLFTPQSM